MNIMQLIMNILASGFAGDVGRIYPQATICRFMVSPIGDHMEQDAQTIALFCSCFSFKKSSQFVTIYYNSAIAMPALSM